MPKLVNTDEYVLVKMLGGHEYAVAATTRSKYGIRVVENPVPLPGTDVMDAIFIVQALNATIKKSRKK
jgi:hypothetical protein